MSTSRPYPRLFCIDLIEKARLTAAASVNAENKKASLQRQNTVSELRSSVDRPFSPSVSDLTCVRPMCEHEEGWHCLDILVTMPETTRPLGAYLARIMNILKNGGETNQMRIFRVEQGQRSMNEAQTQATQTGNPSLEEAYQVLREIFINKFEKQEAFRVSGGEAVASSEELNLDLKRCELKNGKVLWLCEKHLQQTNARELFDNVVTNNSDDQEANKKFLDDLDTIQIDMI
jgi:hypothetical protein